MDRITSLERFGARSAGDFSAENLQKISDAGFNAVLSMADAGSDLILFLWKVWSQRQRSLI